MSADRPRLRKRRANRPGLRILCLLTLLATGCKTWHARAEPPAVVIHDEKPELVRLRSASDGSWIVLADPRLRGDSIIGWKKQGRGLTTLPTAQVDRAEVGSTDTARAVVSIALGAAIIYGIVRAIEAMAEDALAFR
jgi:hypothetical protein